MPEDEETSDSAREWHNRYLTEDSTSDDSTTESSRPRNDFSRLGLGQWPPTEEDLTNDLYVPDAPTEGDDFVGDPIGFGDPWEALKDYKKFKFEESPYYKKHVNLYVVRELAEMALNDETITDSTMNDVKAKGINYLGRKVLGTTLSADSITRNAMMETMFNIATGLTDETLANAFQPGEDMSAEVVEGVLNQANESSEKWSNSIYFGKIRSLIAHRDTRSKLEREIEELNAKFSLGFKPSDFGDDDKLTRMAGQAHSREYAFKKSGQKEPRLYRPGSMIHVPSREEMQAAMAPQN